MCRISSFARGAVPGVTLVESVLAISIFSLIVAAAILVARPLFEASQNRAILADLRLLLRVVSDLSQGSVGYDFLGYPTSDVAYNDGLAKGADLIVSTGSLPERFGSNDPTTTVSSTIFVGSGRLPVSVSHGWNCGSNVCASLGIASPTVVSFSLGTFDFPVSTERLCIDLMSFIHPGLVLAAVRPSRDYASGIVPPETPGPHVPFIGTSASGAATFTSVAIGGYAGVVHPLFRDSRSIAAVSAACETLIDAGSVNILFVFSGVL